MVENRKVDINVARSLLDAEVPYRTLATNAKLSPFRHGMLDARATLDTLANKASDAVLHGEPKHIPLPHNTEVPDGIPPHQAHIVRAAEKYASATDLIANGSSPADAFAPVIFYNESNHPSDSPVAVTQSQEILAILGADTKVEEAVTPDTRIEIWSSSIDGINLKRQNILGAVTIFPVVTE